MPYKDPEKRKEYDRARDRTEYYKLQYQRRKSSPEKLAKVKKWQEEHKEHRKEYAKKWRMRNKERLNKKRRELKKANIKLKGGKCQICGFNGHSSVFDFHHIDQSKKETSEWRTAKYMTQSDMDNLLLVCANCHRMIHHLSNWKDYQNVLKRMSRNNQEENGDE